MVEEGTAKLFLCNISWGLLRISPNNEGKEVCFSRVAHSGTVLASDWQHSL